MLLRLVADLMVLLLLKQGVLDLPHLLHDLFVERGLLLKFTLKVGDPPLQLLLLLHQLLKSILN